MINEMTETLGKARTELADADQHFCKKFGYVEGMIDTLIAMLMDTNPEVGGAADKLIKAVYSLEGIYQSLKNTFDDVLEDSEDVLKLCKDLEESLQEAKRAAKVNAENPTPKQENRKNIIFQALEKLEATDNLPKEDQMADLTVGAYKASEKRMRDYLTVYHVLDRVLSEQKPSPALEQKGYSSYVELKDQLSKVTAIYESIPEVLSVQELQSDVYSVGDELLASVELEEPLQTAAEVEPKIEKLFAELKKGYISTLVGTSNTGLPLVLTNTEQL